MGWAGLVAFPSLGHVGDFGDFGDSRGKKSHVIHTRYCEKASTA